MSKRYETHDCIGNVSDGGPHDISLKNPCTAENTNRQKGKGSAVIVSLCTRVQVFILVSVVNRDISVESFQTIEEAKKRNEDSLFRYRWHRSMFRSRRCIVRRNIGMV